MAELTGPALLLRLPLLVAGAVLFYRELREHWRNGASLASARPSESRWWAVPRFYILMAVGATFGVVLYELFVQERPTQVGHTIVVGAVLMGAYALTWFIQGVLEGVEERRLTRPPNNDL